MDSSLYFHSTEFLQYAPSDWANPSLTKKESILPRTDLDDKFYFLTIIKMASLHLTFAGSGHGPSWAGEELGSQSEPEQ